MAAQTSGLSTGRQLDAKAVCPSVDSAPSRVPGLPLGNRVWVWTGAGGGGGVAADSGGGGVGGGGGEMWQPILRDGGWVDGWIRTGC